MKKKINIIYNFSVLIVVFIISLMITNLGCENQLAPDPIAVDRTFTGKVVEFASGLGIKNANIKITLNVGKSNEFTTVTNDTGGFSLVMPVYSEPKAYLISVYKEGYQQIDTFANCDCKVLTLPLLRLKPMPENCSYYIQPFISIPSTIAVGDSVLFNIEVTNNNKISPLNIIEIISSTPDIRPTVSVPITIQPKPNNILNIPFVFAPTSAKKPYEATIKLRTSCDSALSTVYFTSNSDTRSCIIDVPDARNFPTYDTVYFVQLETSDFIVSSISGLPVRFTFSSLNPSQYFVYLPGNTTSSFNTLVPANSRDTIKIKFNPPAGLTGRYVDTLYITSNGNCGRRIVLIGIYNEIIQINKVLVRWDQQWYWGFRFADDNPVAPDSVNLCNTLVPFKPGSQAVADFRFIGGTYGSNGKPLFATLQAANGMKRIGNLVKDGKGFNLISYQITDKVTGWNNYCSQQYELNDVIAVRTRDNNYALILIDNFYPFGGDGKEKIIFKYIYPVP